MTVVLGLVCSDGVIVAADSMGSDGPIALQTMKVFLLDDLPVIWTASGAVYVIEEVQRALDQAIATGPNSPIRVYARAPDFPALRERLAIPVRSAMEACYKAALPMGLQQGILYQGATQHQFATGFLFLAWSKQRPFFLEIDHTGALNWHTEAAFYAIGSGGPFATVAQGLMGHYWGQPRSVEVGRLVAYRTIATTIDVSSSLVGYPISMAEVTIDGPRLLSAEDVDEVKVGVERWKLLEAETLDRLRTGEMMEEEGDGEELPSIEDRADRGPVG